MTDEADRQQALMAALFGGSGEPAGLQVYRGNARASAARALAACYPTIRAALGADVFDAAAGRLWHLHPPVLGDLAAWGDTFPAWLAGEASLAGWPWLADAARLDLAVHRAEAAADATVDLQSLQLLASAEPERLVLLLAPGSALIESPWPVATIHRVHRTQAEPTEQALAGLRLAIASRQAEQVFVARQGWRAEVYDVPRASARFIDSSMARRSLAESLERAGPGFDFTAWLADAVRLQWLQAVSPVA